MEGELFGRQHNAFVHGVAMHCSVKDSFGVVFVFVCGAPRGDTRANSRVRQSILVAS